MTILILLIAVAVIILVCLGVVIFSKKPQSLPRTPPEEETIMYVERL